MASFKVRPEDEYHFTGEKEVIDRWWHPAKGDVVFDVGCGIGLYSMPAMAAGAYVYAFDSSWEQCKGFLQNAWLNNFSWRDFSLFNTAVGSKNEKEYKVVDGWHAMGIPESITADYKGKEITPIHTLDYFVDRTEKVDWIKMDVEGFELDVLQGACYTLLTHKPKLIIENHSFVNHIGPWMRANGIWPKILLFLKDIGYKKLEEKDYVDSGRSHLYCE